MTSSSYSFVIGFITIYVISNVSNAWTPMTSGGMQGGVTYAGGTIYNNNIMCPNNVNQGYACDGRNWGAKYLNPDVVSAFCSGYSSFGTWKQYGFGHGVTDTQACGTCAQLRVPRLDGNYNYMTVMMVDHFTWSMEVGTVEIEYLLEGTRWVKGDRAEFDFRLVDDCYTSFGDDVIVPSIPTPYPTRATPRPTPTPTEESSGGGGGSSGGGGTSDDGSCRVSSNWGNMKLNPWWGSNAYQMFAFIYNPPSSITKFEIRGADQSDYEFQSCVLQNVNFWQCEIRNGPLTEPASIRLNGGVYIGYNVMESMTGSSAQYPQTGCSVGSSFTEDGDDGSNGMEWTTIFAIIIGCLIGIGCIIIACYCLYKYNKKKKGSAYFEDDNDNNNNKDTTDDVVKDGGDNPETIEVETNVEIVASE